MDTDDLDVGKKLLSIFMPYSTRRQDNFVDRKGRFVHYTSAENAIKIVQSQKFWMRNAKCMSDYMEVAHGHEQLVN